MKTILLALVILAVVACSKAPGFPFASPYGSWPPPQAPIPPTAQQLADSWADTAHCGCNLLGVDDNPYVIYIKVMQPAGLDSMTFRRMLDTCARSLYISTLIPPPFTFESIIAGGHTWTKYTYTALNLMNLGIE